MLHLVLAAALAGGAPDPIPAMDDAIVAADAAIAAQQEILVLLERLAEASAPDDVLADAEAPPTRAPVPVVGPSASAPDSGQ